jgi:hypothetical protein
MLDTLADTLDMPLRHRNDLYLAAGYAAPYRKLGLDRHELAQVKAAVERILASHDPFARRADGPTLESPAGQQRCSRTLRIDD